MKKTEVEVAKLCSVTHDKRTDDVFVTFKVTSDEYKELVFRLARNDEVEVIIRGDKLDIIDHSGDEDATT
jgi:hypothetical protein